MSTIYSPKDVFQLSKSIHAEVNEWLIIFYLNKNGTVLQKRSLKTKQATLTFSFKSLFTPAITHKSSFIILCHNHPSGKLAPSNDDLFTTKKIIKAGTILGITLIDHVIVTPHGYHSIVQNATVLLPSAPQVHQ